jgi:hypothetical protein
VSISFLKPETKQPIRSTEFARRVLATASADNPKLQDEILGAPDWRKWYLRLYAQLAIEEGKSPEATKTMARAALAEFHRHFFTDQGLLLSEVIAESWDQEASEIEIRVITGQANKEPVTIDSQETLEPMAKRWVAEHLAEPGLIEAFRFLDENRNLPIEADLLFAVAGAAEFAPTEDWLRWGGRVAVVARPNSQNWSRLITKARNSAGTLLVPVLKSRVSKPVAELNDAELAEAAGLDIVEDYREITSWLGSLTKEVSQRIVLGLYAYAPKTEHIKVQGVQELLASIAMQKLEPTQLALSWLATPTDSAPAPAAIAEQSEQRFMNRPPARIIRDSLLGIFDAARPVRPKYFTSTAGEKLALINASVQQQGPSYSFSKRTQRYRAYLAHYAGYLVSYAIAPPARTDSVLRHKILRASYRGAPLFGVKPFEVATAKAAMAAILLRDLHDPKALHDKSTTYLPHTFAAIHGGLWRLAYRPSSVWLAATIIGFPALLRKGY